MPFGKVGIWELLIVLLIVVAIFGAGKIASLGGAVGKGVSDFRKAMKSSDEEEPDAKADSTKAESKTTGAAEASQEASGEDV